MKSLRIKLALVGLAVVAVATDPAVAQTRLNLIPANAQWRYNATSNNLGTAWRNAHYNDNQAGWSNGVQLFGNDTDTYPLSFTTVLPAPRPRTMYFRRTFAFNQNPLGVTLVLSNLVEDGAVFYLNGVRIGDIRVPTTDPNLSFNTDATGAPEPHPGWEVLTVQPTNLGQGNTNLLAVELHQSGTASSDAAMAVVLDAILPTPIVITNQPDDVEITVGATLTLEVGAAGSNPRYQWRKDGVNIPNATNAIYSKLNAQLSDAGTYSVTVSNAISGQVSSNAIVTVVQDTTGPELVTAVADRAVTNVIVVTFSEAVAPTSARNTNNYQICNTNGTSCLVVTQAIASGANVQLRLNTNMMANTLYVLTVNNVQDVRGNPVDPNSRIAVSVYQSIAEIGDNWKIYDPLLYPPLTTDAWKHRIYDDSEEAGWTVGAGIFYYGELVLSGDICGGQEGFPITYLPSQTYHFRKAFNLGTNAGTGVLRINALVDDGAVIYINGTEVRRIRMPAGPITLTTVASPGVAVPNCDRVADIRFTGFVNGTNVIAVEVHQENNGSGDPDGLDVAFGVEMQLALTAALPEPKVKITSPANGEVFVGGPIEIAATASDADGRVTNVQFYAGTTLLGNDTNSPYAFSWVSPPAGTHILTAVARDNSGLMATSGPVTITVAQPPTVAITSPTDNAIFTLGAPITITATATAPGSSVSNVVFLDGDTSLGTDTNSPYSISWSNAAAGAHTLRAVVTATSGLKATSAPVSITVRTPPTVAITGPAGGAAFILGSVVNITATASDTDGTISQVQFRTNGVAVGTDTTSPYAIDYTATAPGSITLTAVATDSHGLMATSAPVVISVRARPTVVITAPANGAVVQLGATTNVIATAADSDGTVSQVQFFANGTSIGTDSSAPYSASYSASSAGAVALTAVATDNHGLMATSAVVNITVQGELRLNIARESQPDRIRISWNGTATLQSTSNLLKSNTVWGNVTNVSPYFAPTTGPKVYYRLRN
ncbi:MAG TPA: Ig-like domain-containing protein [Methylomirabilota bacterium]|nr:Ig-like domain-containing protein [Methylomirabilota bacterium]